MYSEVLQVWKHNNLLGKFKKVIYFKLKKFKTFQHIFGLYKKCYLHLQRC